MPRHGRFASQPIPTLNGACLTGTLVMIKEQSTFSFNCWYPLEVNELDGAGGVHRSDLFEQRQSIVVLDEGIWDANVACPQQRVVFGPNAVT